MATSTLFLAGASGAIGRRLVPLLVQRGHRVHGTTRVAARMGLIERLGATAVLVDVFDAEALARAVSSARPDVVIHQVTDLPPGLDPTRMPDALVRNAQVRDVGTRNLVAAAVGAGVQRIVAQSIAWAYAPGHPPYDEEAALDGGAEGARGVSVGGIIQLEDLVLGTPGIDGVVLRYGQLYGPGTGADDPSGASPLHVDAAAYAALLAVSRGGRGIYNVADDNPTVDTAKARRELGWDPAFRLDGAHR